MTDENRLILAMKAGASALENHKAAESMSFFYSRRRYGKPDATIAYLDAAKILREEAARLAADDSAVDNIRCPHCGELFDGGEATNYDVSCAHVECPYCGQPAYIAQSVTYTASAE